jgi:hypothetical protein
MIMAWFSSRRTVIGIDSPFRDDDEAVCSPLSQQDN